MIPGLAPQHGAKETISRPVDASAGPAYAKRQQAPDEVRPHHLLQPAAIELSGRRAAQETHTIEERRQQKEAGDGKLTQAIEGGYGQKHGSAVRQPHQEVSAQMERQYRQDGDSLVQVDGVPSNLLVDR